MSRSYPIWNQVKACIYKSDRSWGAKDVCDVEVLVGSSAKNSNTFVNHTVKRIYSEEYIYFKFYVDDVKIKEHCYENNKGYPGDLLHSFSKIEHM